jgi:hypothetical protein
MSASGGALGRAKRIVFKVGSALLVDAETGAPNRAWLDAFCADAARLRARGQQVVVVSSGAVALGRRRLGLTGRKSLTLPEKQAAAAAGQSVLMHAWENAGAARRGRRPDPADPRRHRDPPPLAERPRHRRDPDRPGRDPRRQRERHGGHRGDPLRRQ